MLLIYSKEQKSFKCFLNDVCDISKSVCKLNPHIPPNIPNPIKEKISFVTHYSAAYDRIKFEWYARKGTITIEDFNNLRYYEEMFDHIRENHLNLYDDISALFNSSVEMSQDYANKTSRNQTKKEKSIS